MSVLAWHFIKDDYTCGHGQLGKIKVGKTYIAKRDIALCKNGLHASKRILDALSYGPGSVVCRVEMSGKILYDDDKLVAEKRKVLWMFDATNLLHEFSCRCAEDALTLVDNPDPRSIAAIEAKRKWLKGLITDKELDAAGAAAGDAAGDAAWAAARAAARDAAGDAAWAAAGDAAWAAAGDAAWAAARATALEKFNRRLTSMVMAEHRRVA